MATLNEALYAHLTNFAAVSALVVLRVYPDVAPANSVNDGAPYLVYSKISGQHPQTSEGVAGEQRDVRQVNSWASTRAAADNLAEQVRLSMAGKRGAFGSGGSTLTAHAITLLGDPHPLEMPRSGDDRAPVYGVAQEWSFWLAETVPTF